MKTVLWFLLSTLAAIGGVILLNGAAFNSWASDPGFGGDSELRRSRATWFLVGAMVMFAISAITFWKWRRCRMRSNQPLHTDASRR